MQKVPGVPRSEDGCRMHTSGVRVPASKRRRHGFPGGHGAGLALKRNIDQAASPPRGLRKRHAVFLEKELKAVTCSEPRHGRRGRRSLKSRAASGEPGRPKMAPSGGSGLPMT